MKTSSKPSIASEIEHRIAYLKSPGVLWVDTSPQQPGQACLVYDFQQSDTSRIFKSFSINRQFFSDRAMDWLNDWFAFTTAADLEGPWDGDGYDSVGWNDEVAKNVDQVIDMLADAWVDALEAGV